MKLSAKNLMTDFIRTFPFLKDEIDKVVDWAGGEYYHIIFGQVFNPYIKEVLLNDFSDISKKTKVVQFLESMAISDDCDVKAILTDSILEELLDYPDEFDRIEPYFLEKTAALLPPIKDFFKYDDRRNPIREGRD